MHKLRISVAFLLLATSSVACSSAGDDEVQTSDDHLNTSSRNEDVQVLKVTAAPSFSVSKGSIYPAVDQEECKPQGTTWATIKQHDTLVSGSLPVTLDCTDAFTKKYGFPTMRAVTLQGFRTRKAEEGYYGYVGFSNGGGGFWVKTVELVVKQSAIDAATFNGIGFYLNSFWYRYYESHPAPGANNGNAFFMFADQVRAQANQYPAATLPSGEKARVIKVMLPSEYALGGTSSVPAFYFRPFAEFVDGADKHQRWDSVASDYFVGFDTQFNRESDVLAH